MASKKTNVVSGEELRARRELRLAAQADPRQEAQRHEAAFLGGINGAQEEFDWLVEHSAWTDLGFASVADWWTTRIRPVMVRLDVRPTPEMVDKVLAKVREAERALPPAQRRTQRELAELALASDWKVRGRTDSRNRRSAAGGDLEDRPADPVDSIPAEAKDAIQTKLDEQAAAAAGMQAADGEDNPTANEGPSEAGSGAFPDGEADRPEPAETPNDFTDEEPAGVVPGDSSTEEDTDARTSDSSATPAAGVTSGGAETGLEAEPPAASSPVLDPCERVVLALQELADEYEALDVDVLGPLLTAEQLAGIDKGLNRVAAIVELLIRWNERAKA